MVQIQVLHRLTPAQLKRLGQIWLAGNQEAHGFIPTEYWEKNQAALLAALPDAEVTVALDAAGQIIGFAGMQGDFLAGIFVARQARQQGVGTQLVHHLQQHHHRITLQVYVKNQAAARFYTALGFTTLAQGTDADTGEAEATMQWHQ